MLLEEQTGLYVAAFVFTTNFKAATFQIRVELCGISPKHIDHHPRALITSSINSFLQLLLTGIW
jgi:hypothetical protein